MINECVKNGLILNNNKQKRCPPNYVIYKKTEQCFPKPKYSKEEYYSINTNQCISKEGKCPNGQIYSKKLKKCISKCPHNQKFDEKK